MFLEPFDYVNESIGFRVDFDDRVGIAWVYEGPEKNT